MTCEPANKTSHYAWSNTMCDRPLLHHKTSSHAVRPYIHCYSPRLGAGGSKLALPVQQVHQLPIHCLRHPFCCFDKHLDSQICLFHASCMFSLCCHPLCLSYGDLLSHHLGVLAKNLVVDDLSCSSMHFHIFGCCFGHIHVLILLCEKQLIAQHLSLSWQ